MLALLAAGGGLLGAPLPLSAMRGEVRKPRVVVELFTSQGCSACPPADALLASLVREPDILGIGYNIDAWDYLGWRDTLARPEFTRRQREYARARGDDAVYTPQMIINGQAHVVGNDRRQVLALIKKARDSGGCQLVNMQARRHKKVLQINIAPAAASLMDQVETSHPEATLWMITMRRQVAVRIRRGENRGRKIAYHQVARHISPVAMWHGKPLRLMLPVMEVMRDDADSCAILLQLNGYGPILAAAAL